MTMESSFAREEGVLKLVHPGRYVEIHRTPVLASDIMEKNPRHFITRPDVFKFPWLVVSPESILMPGRVFYIVPCYTLRRLLRECQYPTRRRSQSQRVAVSSGAGMFEERTTSAVAEVNKSCLKKQSCSGQKARDRHVMFLLPDGQRTMVGRED